MPVRLMSDFKLIIMYMLGFLTCHCVMDCQPIQGVCCLSHNDNWDMLNHNIPLISLNRTKQIYAINVWRDAQNTSYCILKT